MLRSRPTRVLPLLTASRQSERLLWSRASDFVAWLGLGPKDNLDSPSNPVQQPPSKRKTSPKHVAAKHILRPHQPDNVSMPTFQRSLDPKKRKDAVYTLSRFSQKIKDATTSKQLLDVWQVVSQCRPFIVHREEPLEVRLASAEDAGDEHPWLLQVLPANKFAQLSSTRTMFVGSTGKDPDAANLVVTNEALLVGDLVKAFTGINEHKLAIAFFEAYDSDRKVWLQEHQLCAAATVQDDDSSDGENEGEAKSDLTDKKVSIAQITQLPRAVYSCYLRSLNALGQTKKIVWLFENDDDQLVRICSTASILHMILHACYSERNGLLARRAVDTLSTLSPAAVIPLGCYELAIRSNLRDRKRGMRELLNAIYLAQVLHNDGGYILKPDIWSGLIKVSLTMDRPDLALEVFKSYPHHCVPESQHNFRQVLQAASRMSIPTALEMMQFCWVSYNAEYPNAAMLLEERKAYEDTICLENLKVQGLSRGKAPLIPAKNKEAKSELLTTILWELLKHRHAMPSVVQVIDLMEATRSKGGAVALRKAVQRMFEYDMNQNNMSPRAAVENSLAFWGERTSVLSGQGFLVHLLLEKCIKRELDDECELLVNYLLNLDVARVPINSIVKMMEANELRGRFEANARIGDKLLSKISPSNRKKLRDDFYERYLMSHLRLEQFDKVSQQYVTSNLEQRYPHNEVIRTIVQEAAVQKEQA